VKKKFKILSIDGGGIKGVFPAHFLELIESDLADRKDGKTKIYEHFDLITGTSTGGILALALALGIPVSEIHNLYKDNAKSIFGNGRGFFGSIFNSKHENTFLEKLIRSKFKEHFNDEDPRLKDAKTHICIPIYDLNAGKPSVLKSDYHPNFVRDYHIPMYQVAMATSAAPTYLPSFSDSYTDLKGVKKEFANKIDGGVMANNPTLVAFLEAIKAFGKDISELEILSIGTGNRTFKDGNIRRNWGLKYWLFPPKKRIFDLFMQSQSQLVENYVSLLYQGIDKTERENPNFVYDRINVDLTSENYIEMDESNKKRINNFSELAAIAHQSNSSRIMEKHFY
jgi:patatin-like phospholipase/acyl hydrolase